MEPIISDFGFARLLGNRDDQGTTESDVGPIRSVVNSLSSSVIRLNLER